MKKSFLYLLLAVVALSAMFMWGGRSLHATQYDNVTYTLPYLTTSSDKPIYCIITNQSQDNVSIRFSVTANSALDLTAAWQMYNTLSNYAIVYAHQSRMLSFEGLTINLDGLAMGSTAVVNSVDQSYGGRILLMQSGTLGGNISATGNVVGTWSCMDLPMSCFQGTTTPKRNLVGYICSDKYSPLTPIQHFTY